MPLFSVVTSVYNAEAFIKKALTSVRDQTEKIMNILLLIMVQPITRIASLNNSSRIIRI